MNAVNIWKFSSLLMKSPSDFYINCATSLTFRFDDAWLRIYDDDNDDDDDDDNDAGDQLKRMPIGIVKVRKGLVDLSQLYGKHIRLHDIIIYFVDYSDPTVGLLQFIRRALSDRRILLIAVVHNSSESNRGCGA